MELILKEWVDFARSLGQVTSTMDVEGQRDHAELILRAVASDLETPQTPAQQEAKSEGDAPDADQEPSAATSHGVVRAQEGFSLQEMVSEFRALRASVLRLWAKVRFTPNADSFQQLMRFNEAIEEALADSIKTYSHAVDKTAVTKARHRMEALGTLSAGLGHDMTNVLLPMRMSLTALKEEDLPASVSPHVDALRRAVEHLGGLARGLRALSMDPDNSAGSPHSTVLSEWWSSAISPFTWALPNGVRLHAEGLSRTDAALPPVRVPAHVLMQAVFNLVQNAAQALGQRKAANRHAHGAVPAGNIWVSAELAKLPSGAAVRLTIRDDGPGMEAATLARCTEAFFTTKAKDQGTGLGLFLVRSAVERHGGTLDVESKLGEGSSFMLVLPADEPGLTVTTTLSSRARTARTR